MGTTDRGFPYPGFSDSAAPPDHFYNLATFLNSYFNTYDNFVTGQVNNSANNLNQRIGTEEGNRYNADQSQINDYRARDDSINNRISGLIQGGNWTPTFGGSNTSVGNNAASEGHWVIVGDEVLLSGRIVFGSGATFGDGAPVVGNIPFAVYTPTATGTGVLTTGGGPTGYAAGVHLLALDNTDYVIRRINSDGSLGLGSDVGAVPQSSVLSFDLRGRRA